MNKNSDRTEFVTRDKNGDECKFYYITDGDDSVDSEVTFFVYEAVESTNDFFESTFLVIDENTARSIEMTANDNPSFKQKGIPEAIIRIASKVLKKNIQSSPIGSFTTGIFRLPNATKAWERLKAELPDRVTAMGDLYEDGCYVLSNDPDDHLNW
jgi:hypothetical protein